jgi:hypothetical protein
MAPVHPRLVVLPAELTAVLRAIIPPLVAAYAVFVAMVILAWRRPAPRPRWRRKPPAPTAESTGSVLATASFGYIVFLVIVLVFHVWLAGESDALSSAAWSGLLLSVPAVGASAFSALVVPWFRGRKGWGGGDSPE